MGRIRYAIYAAVWAMCALFGAVSVQAVPAYPGWQVKTLTDGSSVRVRLMGDEFYHYWETEDGMLAIEQNDGRFVAAGPLDKWREARGERQVARGERRVARGEWTSGRVAKAPKAIGTEPNLAPRGVVILVNFSDVKMNSAHTRAVFDNLCNAAKGQCTTNVYNNKRYPSAAQYFDDQSSGAYRPVFDVFGPVTLPHKMSYYGEQGERDGEVVNDLYMADFVIDAVEAADAAGCDFSQYDSDDDQWVDFVYFIYAGKGQAYGGTSATIWPHNWSFFAALYSGATHGESGYYFNNWYDNNLLVEDGKYIDNYACSSELDGYNALCGIGTLCHEFGHVMGLPDFYDTSYGSVYESGLTPGEWDIMDGGAYNGNTHCPPNYDPWEKHFFGWEVPVNLGNRPSIDTLYANGTEAYNTFMVNASGKPQGATERGVTYYLEHRVKSGWDEYVPSEGMVVWRMDFDARAWANNSPNHSDTRNAPLFRVAAVAPTEWSDVEDKPVTDILVDGEQLTFAYMGGEVKPTNGWVYYDKGTSTKDIGSNGNLFYWGIMFPGNTLDGDTLSMVALYETETNNTQPITIDIYSGGDTPMEANKVYTQTSEPAGKEGFHEIRLQQPVLFNPTKNLWVILSEEGDKRPAIVSADAKDPNGRWVSLDGSKWEDLSVNYNLPYTFMVRAYIGAIEPEKPEEPEEQGIEEVSGERTSGECQKVLREGQLYLMYKGQMYDVQGRRVR